MPTTEEKLAPYAELVADPEVPAKKIAELADVSVKAVEAARKALDSDGPAPEPEAAPVVEAVEAAPVVEAAPEPEAAPAPSAVKVTAKAMLRTPAGRPWKVMRGDVYSGEQAAFLWTHHRELVVPFPTA